MLTDAFSPVLTPNTRTTEPRLSRLPLPELLALSRAGNTDATHCVVLRYRGIIRRLASKLTSCRSDADDLTSEAYLRVYAVLNSCRDVNTLSGWISRITVNVCHRFYARRRRTQAISLEHLMEVSGDALLPIQDNDPATQVLDAIEQEARLGRFHAALCSLPAHYRDVIQWFYLNNQSYDDITARTGLPTGTIKSRLFRARKILSRKLYDLRT